MFAGRSEVSTDAEQGAQPALLDFQSTPTSPAGKSHPLPKSPRSAVLDGGAFRSPRGLESCGTEAPLWLPTRSQRAPKSSGAQSAHGPQGPGRGPRKRLAFEGKPTTQGNASAQVQGKGPRASEAEGSGRHREPGKRFVASCLAIRESIVRVSRPRTPSGCVIASPSPGVFNRRCRCLFLCGFADRACGQGRGTGAPADWGFVGVVGEEAPEPGTSLNPEHSLCKHSARMRRCLSTFQLYSTALFGEPCNAGTVIAWPGREAKQPFIYPIETLNLNRDGVLSCQPAGSSAVHCRPLLQHCYYYHHH